MLRRKERYISCRRLLDRFITLATHENWSSFKLHPTESPFHAGQTYPASMKISLLLIRCLLLHLCLVLTKARIPTAWASFSYKSQHFTSLLHCLVCNRIVLKRS